MSNYNPDLKEFDRVLAEFMGNLVAIKVVFIIAFGIAIGTSTIAVSLQFSQGIAILVYMFEALGFGMFALLVGLSFWLYYKVFLRISVPGRRAVLTESLGAAFSRGFWWTVQLVVNLGYRLFFYIKR